MPTLAQKISWWLVAFFAICIGLYPLMYIVIGSDVGLLATKTSALLSSLPWNIGFYGHISFGGLALLVGWMQFHRRWRTRHPGFHRKVGMLYVVAVLISGLCGLYIGFFATGGWVAASGFVSLAVIWLFTTMSAFILARNGDYNRHEDMMTFSYAVCFAAVTLRLWLPVLSSYYGAFEPAYKIVAWLCWVPNLLVAYLIIRWRKGTLVRV